MKIKKVVIIGGGILGSQIAYQTAYSGFDVVLLVRKEDSKDAVKQKLDNLHQTYLDTIKSMAAKDGKLQWANGIATVDNFNKKQCIDKANNAIKSIVISDDQPSALKGADLVIESVTENIDIKTALYQQIAPLLDERTVIVTNSSTLLPSKMAKYTGRPSKYLALHFANNIWRNNVAEIMAHDKTAIQYFDGIISFAEAIGMVPLAAKEEKSGYILNSMLVPFLLSAMDLVANGITDPITVDKAWTLGTGAPKGPFQIIDTVGLMTAKNIVLQYQKVPNLFDPLLKKMMLPYNFDGMLRILNEYIDAGKLGTSTGEGFYKYK